MAVMAALTTVGVASGAQASSGPVFTVWDGSGIEYYKQCSEIQPYPCRTFNGGIVSRSRWPTSRGTRLSPSITASRTSHHCALSRPGSQSFSMTCTDRPATEQWQVEVECGLEWPRYAYVRGGVVTGNGTSSATYTGTGLPYLGWGYDVP